LKGAIAKGDIPVVNVGRFWSSHQRFFSMLCTSSKVDHVKKIAE